MIKQINATTFQELMPTGDKVEIGDIDSVDFKPHIKLNRWDGECFIKVALQTTEKTLPILDGDKIYWDGLRDACEFYLEGNKFKFNIILKKKPKTNIFPMDFEAQGLKFYYQPELTPEEIAEGCFRPENVVGSYAVYHATKKNHILGQTNYKAGKAFHWYRPLVWDVVGKKCWGVLNVDPIAGIRTVTIPQEFLDNAVYPVTVDDTFGITAKGGTALGAFSSDFASADGATYTGAAGTGVSMTFWGYDASSTQNVQMGLYKSDDSFETNGNTNSVAVTTNDQEWSANFASAPTLTAIEYRLSFNYDGGGLYVWGDATGEFAKYAYPITFGTWPDPITWSNSASKRKFTIYCTYTPAGGNGYEWSVEELVKADRVYCEAYTGVSVDTRRDITDEEDQEQIISDMKAAYPDSDVYYKHTHPHYNNPRIPCTWDEV